MLKAALIFKGITIEWVTVKGYDETFDDDLWAESRHQVFRKVQDHTHAAMLHFYSPTLPELAVKFFAVNFFFVSDMYKENQHIQISTLKMYYFFLCYYYFRLGCIAIWNFSANHVKSVEIIYSTHIHQLGVIFASLNHSMRNANNNIKINRKYYIRNNI